MALDRLTDIRATDTGILVRELNIRLRHMNRIVGEVEILQNTIQGLGTATPKFSNHIDMQNHRLLHVLRSSGPDQYVTRRELQELGIYTPNPGRALETDSLNIKTKLTVNGAAVTTITEVHDLIIQNNEAELATIRDGDTIDLEDFDGTSGSTAGTLLYGVGADRKARLVHVNRSGAVVTEDPRTAELLEALLETMEKVLEKLETS